MSGRRDADADRASDSTSDAPAYTAAHPATFSVTSHPESDAHAPADGYSVTWIRSCRSSSGKDCSVS